MLNKKNIKKKLDSIILTTTFEENVNDIIDFIEEILGYCKNIKKQYYILPVIVFEQKEAYKYKIIKKYFNKDFKKTKPILLINKESTGFPACLNYGILKTDSKYIIRIDTDDHLTPFRLKLQLDDMNKFNLDICSGFMKNSQGRIMRYPNSLNSLLLMTAFGTNPIAHPSICIRRNILENLYDENLNKCEDFDLWLRLFLTKSPKFKCIKKPITIYSEERSKLKNLDNAYFQIKIRLKFIFKMFIISTVLLIGIFPNILRIIIPKRILMELRRRI